MRPTLENTVQRLAVAFAYDVLKLVRSLPIRHVDVTRRSPGRPAGRTNKPKPPAGT